MVKLPIDMQLQGCTDNEHVMRRISSRKNKFCARNVVKDKAGPRNTTRYRFTSGGYPQSYVETLRRHQRTFQRTLTNFTFEEKIFITGMNERNNSTAIPGDANPLHSISQRHVTVAQSSIDNNESTVIVTMASC